jgi:tripartite-type tricarboxylate transporter receptor subunit TctC
MNPYVVGSIALGTVGVIAATSKNKSVPDVPTDGKSALDPGMDRIVAMTVAMALKQETDPNVMSQYAQACKDAGYQNSATALAAKAATLKTNITSPAKGS